MMNPLECGDGGSVADPDIVSDLEHSPVAGSQVRRDWLRRQPESIADANVSA
jgi:hypothetical protein